MGYLRGKGLITHSWPQDVVIVSLRAPDVVEVTQGTTSVLRSQRYATLTASFDIAFIICSRRRQQPVALLRDQPVGRLVVM